MNRILSLALLILVSLSGCGQSAIEKKLDDEVSTLIATYEKPEDTPEDEWLAKATRRAKKEIAESANADFLRILAADSSKNVRVIVAKNPNTPDEIKEGFLNSKDDTIRNYLAANPSLSKEAFDKLSRDEKSNVRQAAAANPNNLQENLMSLAGDSDLNVQQFLARNPNISEAVMLAMAEKSHSSTLEILLNRRGLSQPILEALANHDDAHVSAKAKAYGSVEHEGNIFD